MITRAKILSQMAHRGQTDKTGQPYFTHPARVAAIVTANGGTDEQIATAYLHDTIEDTWVTENLLGQLLFAPEVVAAVVALTHGKNEPADDYYRRVKANPIALAVKLADIEDNTDPVRVAALDQATQERLAKKYAHAREVLLG